MQSSGIWKKLFADFDVPVFDLLGTPISPKAITIFAAIVVAFYIAAKIAQHSTHRVIGRTFSRDQGSAAAAGRLVQYFLVFVGLGVALHTIGIKMSALFAAGAVFAIAIGFAMQNIMQNFVAGTILLMERSIKPGDILEVEGNLIKVKETGIRSTIGQTLFEEDIIIPNSILVQSTVKNFTLKNSHYRLGASVGVTYGSDMRQVMEVLTKTAESMPWRLQKAPATVQMAEFGDSSVNFRIWVLTDKPWQRNQLTSELNQAIWFALKDAGITIAFPQLDVHFDPPTT